MRRPDGARLDCRLWARLRNRLGFQPPLPLPAAVDPGSFCPATGHVGALAAGTKKAAPRRVPLWDSSSKRPVSGLLRLAAAGNRARAQEAGSEQRDGHRLGNRAGVNGLGAADDRGRRNLRAHFRESCLLIQENLPEAGIGGDRTDEVQGYDATLPRTYDRSFRRRLNERVRSRGKYERQVADGYREINRTGRNVDWSQRRERSGGIKDDPRRASGPGKSANAFLYVKGLRRRQNAVDDVRIVIHRRCTAGDGDVQESRRSRRHTGH
jgi:hypothetical protein